MYQIRGCDLRDSMIRQSAYLRIIVDYSLERKQPWLIVK